MFMRSLRAFMVTGSLVAAWPIAPAMAFDLSVAMGADPVSLDPRKAWSAQGYSINAHVFEPLVFRGEKDGRVVLTPLLAESWTQVTPTELQFKIREGVKFQDGEPLDANAVAYTISSIKDDAFVTNLKLWVRDIASVEVTGPYTLVLKTKTPVRGLLNLLVQVPIVAPQAAKAPGFEQKPIGTGPYRVVSYTPNGQVVLEKNPDYWGKAGNADTITFRIMPETSTRLAALQAGEVQIAENMPPDKLQSLRADKDIQIVSAPTLRVDYMALNHRNPIMANRAFREALSLAIDRQGIIDALLGGATKPANSISPPGTVGYDVALPPYSYDPKRAKELLAEAGYKGELIKLGGPIGRYAMDKQVTEAIAGMFQDVGIHTSVETLAFSSYYPKFSKGDFDVSFIGWTDFTVTPQKHWSPLFYTPVAITKYSNPVMDKIIEAATVELDDQKAAMLFKQGQALQHDEFGSVLPLYWEPQLIGLSAKVDGFAPRRDEYIMVGSVKLKQ